MIITSLNHLILWYFKVHILSKKYDVLSSCFVQLSSHLSTTNKKAYFTENFEKNNIFAQRYTKNCAKILNFFEHFKGQIEVRDPLNSFNK